MAAETGMYGGLKASKSTCDRYSHVYDGPLTTGVHLDGGLTERAQPSHQAAVPRSVASSVQARETAATATSELQGSHGTWPRSKPCINNTGRCCRRGSACCGQRSQTWRPLHTGALCTDRAGRDSKMGDRRPLLLFIARKVLNTARCAGHVAPLLRLSLCRSGADAVLSPCPRVPSQLPGSGSNLTVPPNGRRLEVGRHVAMVALAAAARRPLCARKRTPGRPPSCRARRGRSCGLNRYSTR